MGRLSGRPAPRYYTRHRRGYFQSSGIPIVVKGVLAMKRRDFIKALPLGVAAAGIPFSVGGFAGTAFGRSPLFDALLSGADTSDRVLVLINLQGGNDGLNT